MWVSRAGLSCFLCVESQRWSHLGYNSHSVCCLMCLRCSHIRCRLSRTFFQRHFELSETCFHKGMTVCSSSLGWWIFRRCLRRCWAAWGGSRRRRASGGGPARSAGTLRGRTARKLSCRRRWPRIQARRRVCATLGHCCGCGFGGTVSFLSLLRRTLLLWWVR